jgi:hypothetical protein
MSDEAQKTTPLRKVELGVLVTVALAVIGFAFWLGKLQSQVDRVDADTLKKEFDSRVGEAVSKSVVPKGTIIAWFASSGPVPNGWIICDGAPGSGTPDLRGRFLRGTTDFGQVGQTGGSETHSHHVAKNGHLDGHGWENGGTCELGDTDPCNHLPPYTQVVYIMKNS